MKPATQPKFPVSYRTGINLVIMGWVVSMIVMIYDISHGSPKPQASNHGVLQFPLAVVVDGNTHQYCVYQYGDGTRNALPRNVDARCAIEVTRSAK